MTESHLNADSVDERFLSQKQTLLDFAVSNSPAIFYIAVLNDDQPVRFISSNIEKLTGHKQAAFLSHAEYGRRFIHPDDLSPYQNSLAQLRTDKSLSHEYRFRNAAGEYQWFRDELRLADSGGGEFIGCMVEITEEKQSREQLNKAEAINAAIIETTLNAIIVTDQREAVLEFNVAAERMFGRRRNDVLGRPLHEILYPKNGQKRHLSSIRTHLGNASGADQRKRIEFDATDGNGRNFPVEMSLTQAEVEGQSIFVAVINDISDRKRAEEERERLSNLFHDAVESLESGFSIVDEKGRIVACNTALTRNLRVEPETFIGKPRKALIEQSIKRLHRFDGQLVTDSDAWVERINDRFESADGDSIEVEFENGRWVLLTCQPTSEGGQVTVGTDITKLKQAENELRESEDYLRSMLEENPLPVWLVDVETAEVLYASPAAAELVGREWPLQGSIFSADYYADTEDRDRVIETLRQDGMVLDYETQFRRVDGSLFWVSLNSRLFEYQGREVTITGLVDLTERKRRESELQLAEAELRQSERYFRSMVEDNPLSVYLVDLETAEILYASPAAAELIGREWPFEGPVFTTDFFVDLSDRERLIERLRQEGGLVVDYETRFRRTNGEEIWVALNTRVVEYQGREFTINGLVDLTERKRRETELQQAQETLEDAIESLSEGFVLYDAEDRLVLCNEQYKAFNHMSADLFVPGAKWIDITRERARRGQFPNAEENTEAWLAERVGERGLITAEAFPIADGSWYEHSHRRTRQGGIVITWRDVTEQREREEAVLRAHETLEDAVESLSEGFALYDDDDRLVMCNQRYREFNEICRDIIEPGLEFSELIREGAGRGQYRGSHEDVERWLQHHVDRRSASEPTAAFEYRQHDDRWFIYSNQPTRQGGTVVTLTDITERKGMESALRESEAAVRQILEASPIPITMARAEDGQIIYESPIAQTLFRYDASDGFGTTLERWNDPVRRHEYLRHLRQHGAIDGAELQLKRRDGSTFWASLSARLTDYLGQEVIISSIFDLTDLRTVEEEMRRQREALHQSEKLSALGQLLASVAHELNNPLSVVVGQSLLLRETVEDERIAARAERIGNAADRCARIVKTFLAMARQQPQESGPANVNELIEAALEVTGYSLRASGVEITLSTGGSVPPVFADADQLTQVFTNLIVNAEHALRDIEGVKDLRISSRHQKQTNEIIVKFKDNGPGVPEEIRRRIFEPFFTTKEVGSGTGLGLALCHRILETHGGRIKVETTPGGGATFVIRLPVMSDAEAPADQPPSEQVTSGPLSILVVDDEPDVAELLADILGNDGHDVKVASSGGDAFEYINQHEFDVILSDVRMPDIDGPTMFRTLRIKKPDLVPRIAFITGDTMSADIKTFLKKSGRDHIEKPITPDEVRKLVQRVAKDYG